MKIIKETKRETKAKRIFTNPKYMSKILTFAIFTASNPDKVQTSRETNLVHNKNLERALKTMTERGYQFYKVKGKYDNVEDSYIVYNISLSDTKALCSMFGQQSFIFATNDNGDLTFQFWANASRSGYNYKKVDEKKTYVLDNDFENYYTQISRDFKFNIPFDVFDVSPSDMVETMEMFEENNQNYAKYLSDNLKESVDDTLTSNARLLARSRLYGKMANWDD